MYMTREWLNMLKFVETTSLKKWYGREGETGYAGSKSKSK